MKLANAHIESVPGKCGGKPVIAGTRIRVWDIYCQYERAGKSADQILAYYPELSLSQIYAALTFYYDHKAEIDQQMKEADEFVADLIKTSSTTPFFPATGDPVSS